MSSNGSIKLGGEGRSGLWEGIQGETKYLLKFYQISTHTRLPNSPVGISLLSNHLQATVLWEGTTKWCVIYIKKKNPHSSWCCNLHSLQETTSHESTVQRMMLPTVRQIQLLFLHVRCHRTLECYKTTVRLCSHETCMQGSSKLGLLHLAFIAHLLLSHSKLILSTMNHSTQPRLANSII